MRRWMVTVAVVGLVLGPLLAILRFLRNPYFDDPRYYKAYAGDPVPLGNGKGTFQGSGSLGGKEGRVSPADGSQMEASRQR